MKFLIGRLLRNKVHDAKGKACKCAACQQKRRGDEVAELLAKESLSIKQALFMMFQARVVLEREV